MSATAQGPRTFYDQEVLRCCHVLSQLALLADADASRAPSEGASPRQAKARRRPKATSSIPRRVTLDGAPGGSHAPAKSLSLYAHFKFRMERAAQRRDEFLLAYLRAEAQMDLDAYRGTGKRKARELEPDPTGQLARDRLLNEHRGLQPAVVVLYEHGRCSEEWVKRERVRKGFDPTTGHPVSERQGDETHGRILELRQEHPDWTLGMIAAEVGRDKSTVSRVLRGKVGATDR